MKSLSRVQLLVTPWTAAYQAPPSMGFSKQEYWSGVPLPSLLYLLECAKSLQLCPTFCDPRLLCPWDSPGKNTEWAAMPSSKGSSRPRDQTHIYYISCIGTSTIWEDLNEDYKQFFIFDIFIYLSLSPTFIC